MAIDSTKVLLVTGQYLFGQCLGSALDSCAGGFETQTIDEIGQAILLLEKQYFDVAIFHVDPPNCLTPAQTKEISRQFENTRLIIVGRCRDEREIVDYLQSGAIDFRVTDSESLQSFCQSIDDALSGNPTFGPERTKAIFERLKSLSTEVERINTIDTSMLTDREMEILKLVDEGKSNKDIAKLLHISLHTVKNHVHRILEKLKVGNRREAVHLAYSNGWLKMKAI